MLEVGDEGVVRVLRMAHGKVSALDVELLDALSAAVQEASQDACRAVVLTGTGRAFSAGVDLERLLGGGKAYTRSLLASMHQTFMALFELGKPVVAAVNGHAIAGGCILACTADRRFGATGNWRAGLSELDVGVPFPSAPLAVASAAIGDAATARLVMSAALVDPEAALALGLLDTLVDPQDLMPAALVEARRLADIEAASFSATKALLRRPFVERVVAAVEADRVVADLWVSDGVQDAVRRFVQRTL